MVHVDLVDVDGIKVKITVVNTEVEVDDQVATFLQNKDGKRVKAWTLSGNWSRTKILNQKQINAEAK